jgi:hypothetical protein
MDNTLKKLVDKQYKDGVTLITPTGDRQIAFFRCEYYISLQTVKPNQHIIVDDGHVPTVTSKASYELYIRKQPVHDKAKSLTTNIVCALPHIEYNKILIIEDDDYYCPEYIERMVVRLSGQWDLVGEAKARYYNVKYRKYKTNNNRKSASFCQTAIRTRAIDALYVSCLRENSSFIDTRLWDKNIKKNVFEDFVSVIGIKGMPGRLGIGSGHRPSKNYKDDKDLTKLKQWLPEEAVEFYSQFYKPK